LESLEFTPGSGRPPKAATERTFRTQSAAELLYFLKAHSCPMNRPLGVVVLSVGRRALLKTHKYSIGQNVRYTSGPFGRFGASGSFKIVKLLPPEGDEHQYRIKSTGEAFERVAKESQLDRER
jgi:hypothetical protein